MTFTIITIYNIYCNYFKHLCKINLLYGYRRIKYKMSSIIQTSLFGKNIVQYAKQENT